MKRDILDNEQISELKKNLTQKITRQIQKTRALKFSLFIFLCRLTVFLVVLGLYLTHRDWVTFIVNEFTWRRFTIIHVIWVLFMLIMISHVIPNNRLTMAWRKAREDVYVPAEDYDELELLRFTQKQNIRAWTVLLVWLCFNAVFGILYLTGVIEEGDLLMLSVFYFLSDYICILFFCPFQTGIMKNKCCINCRIYDWGHFMMFTPMLFIKNFYSWSLFFTSVVVLIHWEIIYAQHPERFWEGSNLNLRCANCREKTCQIKTHIKNKVHEHAPGIKL